MTAPTPTPTSHKPEQAPTKPAAGSTYRPIEIRGTTYWPQPRPS